LLAFPIVAACTHSGGGAGAGSGSATAPATSSVATVPGATSTPAVFGRASWPHLAAGYEVTDGPFSTSILCASCHQTSDLATSTALKDAKGRAVGPFDLWQATMMANAARDPLWRAEVSVEVLLNPASKGAIESTCLSCHTPMATTNARSRGSVLTMASLGVNTAEAQLGLDGVSCTHCHQQAPDPANVPATFDGNWTIAPGQFLFGPYDSPYQTPMSLSTEFLPVKGTQVRASSTCASCHTLHTNGLPEQTPYLEWENSVFNDEVASPGPRATSCQGCHVPQADLDGNPISTLIAHQSGGPDFPQLAPRAPFGRHLFVGGNTLVPAILRDQAADLQPLAPASAFDDVIAAARAQLGGSTASVSLGPISRMTDTLVVPVQVTNLAGHKFPTGHPTRRAWLELQVKDASGRTVFVSGGFDAAGRLVDGSGNVLASELPGGPLQVHRAQVTASDQVEVYESVMADAQGNPTFVLLQGRSYVKDNRLLPEGWSASDPSASDTAPRGIANDPAFVAGGHTVVYSVPAPAAAGPYTVEATLLYEPLSARFAAELFTHRTPEIEAFETYYEAADRTPSVVAQAVANAP
jgi:hypothetical protein